MNYGLPYTVSMQGDRAYIGVSGEAATNGKVIAEIGAVVVFVNS